MKTWKIWFEFLGANVKFSLEFRSDSSKEMLDYAEKMAPIFGAVFNYEVEEITEPKP